MRIASLAELRDLAAKVGPKKISVANPAEDEIFEALRDAYNLKMIKGFLVGPKDIIEPFAKKHSLNPPDFQIIDCQAGDDASQTAVKLVREKTADFLMKGTVSTSQFLKAVLNKDSGLRKEGHLLSHVAIHEIPGFSRLLIITDAAFNIKPNLEEKAQIIDNAIKVANVIGVEKPRVACVAAIEKVNPKIASTVDAAELANMAKHGRFKHAFVEGPFGFDNAVDEHSAQIKGVKGDVAGKADIILAPDMDSGNVIYKTLTTMAHSIVAAVVVGTTAPVILTSRADSEETKLTSLALGVLDAHYSY
ncbi:bifunctional enoyl-CoA hydratase/phosphate acetyltransferase [bacterium]|nr:bifunctional enoyl-CoA hydratase/phosphate acetyltransferase [candidate division CSSED10-310 bacterium]